MSGAKPLTPILALSALLLVGCFTSKSLRTLHQEGSSRAALLDSIKLLETTAPDQAAEQYRQFLTQESSFNKPLLYYQKQFRMQLRQMRTSNVQVLGDSVLAAFPLFFHRRLAAQVRAHLGLARLHLAGGKTAQAEASVQKAIRLVNRRSRSFLFSGRELLAAYVRLRSVHERTGATGKALVAKLNADLLADFMGSGYALEAAADDEEKETRIDERMQDIDKFIAKVNRQRTAKAAAELASVLSNIAGGFDVGGTALDISLAAAEGITFSMDVVTTAMLAVAEDPSTAGLASSAKPMANPVLASQLLEARMGQDPGAVIKGFLREAVKADGSTEMKKAAEKVSTGWNAVAEAQGPRKLAAVKELVKNLYSLEARVQDVRSARSGQ